MTRNSSTGRLIDSIFRCLPFGDVMSSNSPPSFSTIRLLVSSLRLARDPGAIRTENLGFGSSGLRIKIGVAELTQGSLDERLPVRAKSFLRGWWSRPDTCQDYFFSVSQQDIDRLEASIREQTNPLHHREPIPDVILIVRRIAEEAIIVAQ